MDSLDSAKTPSTPTLLLAIFYHQHGQNIQSASLKNQIGVPPAGQIEEAIRQLPGGEALNVMAYAPLDASVVAPAAAEEAPTSSAAPDPHNRSQGLLWASQWLRAPSRLPAQARLLLFALADSLDETGTAWVNDAELAGKTNLSERKIKNLLKELVQLGLVSTGVGKSPATSKPAPFYRLHTPAQSPELLVAEPERSAKAPDDGLPRWAPREFLAQLPAWLPRELWMEWEVARRGMHNPLTPPARTRLLNQLTKFKEARGASYAKAVIDQSIANSWRGFFELKGTALERWERHRRMSSGQGELPQGTQVVRETTHHTRGTVRVVEYLVSPAGKKFRGVVEERKATPEELAQYDAEHGERSR